MENSNKQTPASTNQIETTRPKVGRSFSLLTGNIMGSMNAGHERLIEIQEVMAGSKIAVKGTHIQIQTLTPKTPAFQRLKACIKVIKVPFIRVWKNYEKFAAQRGGASEEKIEEMPNLAGLTFPILESTLGGPNQTISIQETTEWRDCFASCIIPRVGAGAIAGGDQETDNETPYNLAPYMNALYLRAHVAAYNDILRNKEYDEERTEYYNMDSVTQAEWDSYMPDAESITDYYNVRCKKDDSYYSNYRAELQGFESALPNSGNIDYYAESALINFTEWQHSVNEAFTQASNAQKNDWDIYTEMRGAKKLTQGRVELIAKKTFDLNYAAVTQNAYNNNTDIEEQFRVLGKQGAYSYTDIDLTFLNGIEIQEDGLIMVYLSVTADTVYESAVDRQLLNINWKDRYRPDLAREKNDILMNIETGTPYAFNSQTGDEYQPLGFKRKFSEYFKLGNWINGEMMNRGYYQTNPGDSQEPDLTARLIPNNTYQFNEFSATKAQAGTTNWVKEKKHWKDYSDLMINKNSAIPADTYENDEGDIVMLGHHQIFYVGETYCVIDMPIEEEIKNNFVKYSEY